MAKKKLYRILEGKILGGVCTGIAEFWDLDVTLVRLIFVLLSLPVFAFIGVVLYIALWIITPAKAEREKRLCPGCQKEVSEGFAYCPHCGRSLKPVCLQCSASLEPGWDHCPKCGATVESKDQ